MNENMRYGALRRLMTFLVVTVACFVACMIVMAIISYKGINPARLRLATMTQSIMAFLLPALLTALLVTYKPWKFLKLHKAQVMAFLMGILVLLVGVPALNSLAAWNQGWHLPQSLAGLEQWLKASESSAQATVDMVLGGTGAWDLILGVIIVGILPGVCEEFYFRGSLQGLLETTPRIKVHTAIWITAVVFSAMHMQFFGFVPRLLLGAYFGYLVYWTGSLWVPVTVHAFNNSLIVVVSWLGRRGATDLDLETTGTESWPVVAVSVVLTILGLIALKKFRANNR